MIVADTNLIACFLLKGPASSAAESVFLADPAWIVPRLWRSEFRNVLATHLRAGLVELEDAREIFKKAALILSSGERDVPEDRILGLAAESGCSAYDCEFVALAEFHQVPLVTADKKLLKAFPGSARSFEKFLEENKRVRRADA